MIHTTISAAEFAPMLEQSSATLTSYCRPRMRTLAAQGERWGVIICPGGGYELIADTEAEPVALSFLAGGVQAFVLRYSVLPACYPQQLRELACAVAWLRLHAEEYGVNRGAVCGGSAGGHLAGCLANRWSAPELTQLKIDAGQMRPDAVVMSYPVVSSRAFETLHPLAGIDASLPEYTHVNIDTSVTAENPPAFLWCTESDRMVPMENTLAYALSLRRAGVSFELHIFPDGPHAMSTATAESAPGAKYANEHVARWLPLCLEWLQKEV